MNNLRSDSGKKEEEGTAHLHFYCGQDEPTLVILSRFSLSLPSYETDDHRLVREKWASSQDPWNEERRQEGETVTFGSGDSVK